jgi:hypothetical protein
MTFTAQSSSQEDFDQWVESVRSSPSLSLDEYNKLVEPSSYNAPATYVLSDLGLFDWIVMKYMMPMQGMSHD